MASTFNIGAVLRQSASVTYLQPSHFRMIIQRIPDVVYTCQGFNLPAFSVGNAVYPNPFINLPVSGDHLEYEDLNVTFLIDEKMSNYRSIQDWIVGLSFPENFSQYKNLVKNNQISPQFSGVHSDVWFVMLDNQERPLSITQFQNASPVGLSGITFDTKNVDSSPAVATVTFKYHLFKFHDI